MNKVNRPRGPLLLLSALLSMPFPRADSRVTPASFKPSSKATFSMGFPLITGLKTRNLPGSTPCPEAPSSPLPVSLPQTWLFILFISCLPLLHHLLWRSRGFCLPRSLRTSRQMFSKYGMDEWIVLANSSAMIWCVNLPPSKNKTVVCCLMILKLKIQDKYYISHICVI